MFPTKDEARQIAIYRLGDGVDVIRVTDIPNEIGLTYKLPPECWYILYANFKPHFAILESTNYLAVNIHSVVGL